MKRCEIICVACWIVLIAGVLAIYNFAQNFTPEIQAPEITAVRSDGDGAITVEWSAVDYATSYRVFRRAEGQEWQRIKVLPSSSLTYTDTDILDGNCEYALRACNGSMGNINLSDYSIPASYHE